LITAMVGAFILEPFVSLLMRARLPRALASFVVCVVALMILYLVGLGFYAQVVSLYRELPAYSSRIAELAEVEQGNGPGQGQDDGGRAARLEGSHLINN
ncbi:MAG: AI-2E family transporter, partial [Acidobacteriales bacterium]